MDIAEQGRERRRAVLVDELKRAGGKALSVRELMQLAKLHPGERTEVKRELRDLTREGLLLRDGKRFSMRGAKAPAEPAGALALPRQGPRRPPRGGDLLGTLKKHRDGYGFVARLDRKGEDVFVPPDEAAQALDGDLVRIEVVPARGGRKMGRILEVVERRRRLLIGTYHARGAKSFVVPVDAELEGYVPVPETSAAQDGEVVKVAIDPDSHRLAGRVIEAIGRPGEPRVEVLKVAYAKGFSDVFPDPVRAEAEAVPDRVRPEDREGRRDLTSLPLVTIDGEDARDFDDAVHVERVEGKGKGLYRLVVAIADVAHYVRAGAALDGEAARRGTSVYFPMQVLPMLPERLSNGICSLNPDVDRLCMVADLVLDGRGEVKSADVYEAVMRSHARCTYTEVAGVLAGEHVPGRDALRERFQLMAELQEKLTTMRARRGAIDFDLPEAKIVLDEHGNVAAIEKRPRNRAHRIVEEFMLAANEAVARWFGARDLPTIYRVHGTPDEEKLRAFLELAESHGFQVPEIPADPRALNALLHRFHGHAQQRALNQLLLRAMMQAVYSPENVGHYGLAAEHYLHFTSPIRRYPDLIVHRLLKEEWARRQGRQVRATPPPVLEELAALSSERERAAMEAEREIAAFYAALFMKDKVGERFDGVVASVVEFGLFVELERYFVEGLVRAEDLGEALELDPVQHALVDRTTGRAYRVGDRVTVELLSASPQRRRIELGLVREAARAEPQPARRRAAQARPEAAPRPAVHAPPQAARPAAHARTEAAQPKPPERRAGGERRREEERRKADRRSAKDRRGGGRAAAASRPAPRGVEVVRERRGEGHREERARGKGAREVEVLAERSAPRRPQRSGKGGGARSGGGGRSGRTKGKGRGGKR